MAKAKEKDVKLIKQHHYTFDVTEQEANVIMKGLGELPAKVSFIVIGKMQGQFAVQQKNIEKNKNKDKK